MNKKRQRASRKNRRFCPNATTTRQTNGLQDEKVIYNTEQEAWAAITAKTRNAVLTMESLTPYLCRPTADHYHIGRRIKHADTARDHLMDTLRTLPGASKVLRNA